MGTFAIISLIFGVIMSAVSIASTAHANKQNEEIAKEMQEDQQQFNAQQAENANEMQRQNYWDMYSPASKAQQLRDAGLSVGLMYGGGGVQGSGAGGYQAQSSAPSVPMMNPLVQGGQMGEMMNMLKTVTESKKTTEEAKNLETEREKMNAEMSKIFSDIQRNNSEIDLNGVKKSQMELQNVSQNLQNMFDATTYNDRVQSVEQAVTNMQKQWEIYEEQVKGLNIENSMKEKLLTAQYNLMVSQAADEWSKVGLNNANAELAKEKTSLTKIDEALHAAQAAKNVQEIKYLEAQKDKAEKEVNLTQAYINYWNAVTEREQWYIDNFEEIESAKNTGGTFWSMCGKAVQNANGRRKGIFREEYRKRTGSGMHGFPKPF